MATNNGIGIKLTGNGNRNTRAHVCRTFAKSLLPRRFYGFSWHQPKWRLFLFLNIHYLRISFNFLGDFHFERPAEARLDSSRTVSTY